VPGKGDILKIAVLNHHKSPLRRILARQEAVKLQDVTEASELRRPFPDVKETSPKAIFPEGGIYADYYHN
jgi:hypothetical protein